MVIAGAAGRDFHNFNLVYRDSVDHEVVAFTATQIPNIEGRLYPPALAGELYPDGIPIIAEDELEAVIAQHEVDEVVFSYSDVTHEHVMHVGSRALAAGASYKLLSPRETMLSLLWPQCEGICRPCEFGSASAATAESNCSSGVMPSCKQSARSR